jgi:hypothetical protein
MPHGRPEEADARDWQVTASAGCAIRHAMIHSFATYFWYFSYSLAAGGLRSI